MEAAPDLRTNTNSLSRFELGDFVSDADYLADNLVARNEGKLGFSPALHERVHV